MSEDLKSKIKWIGFFALLMAIAFHFTASIKNLKQDKLITLEFEFRESEQHIHETISLATGFLKVIQSHGGTFSSHLENLDQTPFRYLKPSDVMDGYSLNDTSFWEISNQTGNLTGSGSLKELSNEHLHDIILGFSMTPLFRLTQEYVPNAPWFYYISSNEFIYLYPHLPDSEYCYVPDVLNHQVFQLGLPEYNPGKDHFWTSVYIDRAEEALMVTVGIPIYQGAGFKGVVALDLTLNNLSNYLTTIQSKEALIFLADLNGDVIANPDLNFNKLGFVAKADSLIETFGVGLMEIDRAQAGVFTKINRNQIIRSKIEDTPWTLYLIKSNSRLFWEVVIELIPQFIIAMLILGMLLMIFRLNKAQKQIKASEVKFKSVFNELKQMMFVLSPELCIVESNTVSGEITGMHEDIVKKSKFYDLPIWQQTAGLREKFALAISDAKNGKYIHFETVLNSSMDRERTFDFTFFPIHDHLGKVILIIVSGYDITDLKETQKRLRHTIEELKQTQDQLIISEKKAAFGQLAASLAHELNNPMAVIKASFVNYQEAATSSLANMCLIKSVLSPSEIVFAIGLVERYLDTVEDVSSREKRKIKKQLEERIVPSDVIDSGELIENMLNLKIKSPDVLSEHISNPNLPIMLNLSRGFASLYKNRDSISYSIKRALNVVSSFKEYAGKDIKAAKETLILSEAVDIVLNLLKALLVPGIEIVKDIDANLYILMSKDDLYQVFTHIIKNAIQATQAGGKIFINIKKADQIIILRVKDNGPGIPVSIQDKIFEPFFTTKDQGQGAGLGLYIVSDIITNIKGSITFESAVGKGTEFIIGLPLD